LHESISERELVAATLRTPGAESSTLNNELQLWGQVLAGAKFKSLPRKRRQGQKHAAETAARSKACRGNALKRAERASQLKKESAVTCDNLPPTVLCR